MTDEQSNLLDTWISHIDPQAWPIEEQMAVHEANERMREAVDAGRKELHQRPVERPEFK